MTAKIKKKSSVRDTGSKQSGRASIRILGFLLLVGLGLGAVFFLSRRPAPIQQPQAPVAENQPAPQEAAQPSTLNPQPLPVNSQPPTQAPARPPSAIKYQPSSIPLTAALPEPSGYSRQLVSGLSRMDPSAGPLTPERAAEWKANMQLLIQQGATGVGAVREFLDKNVDMDF